MKMPPEKLTDEDLDELTMDLGQRDTIARAVAEIRYHRAMVKRLDALVAQLECQGLDGIADELRARVHLGQNTPVSES